MRSPVKAKKSGSSRTELKSRGARGGTGEDRVRRHADAGQEGAEQRVDADQLREQRRGEDEDEDGGQKPDAAGLLLGRSPGIRAAQRPDHEEHAGDEQQGEADGQQRAADAVGLHDGDHHGQQAPGGDVVHRRAGDARCCRGRTGTSGALSRMRASTGKAVMLMATPMNRAKALNGTPAGASER